MDDIFLLLVGLALLALAVVLLIAGGVAFVMVLGLGKRLRRLEERVGELSGEPVPPAPRRAGPKAKRARAPKRPAARREPSEEPLEVLPVLEAETSPPGRTPAAGASRARAGPSFRETWDSLERRLGIRWLNWIGAIVVLVALAFLLKFLYDRNLIGPPGRVGVGLGAGLGLLAFGELRLRRVHDVLSQAVSATGIGALFLTTYLAFKFYGFSGRVPTFGLMVWFAAFAVTLAVVRRGRILAVLGLVCAYACPFLLSTGQDQAEALFAFLGLLALAGGAVRLTRNWPETTPLGLVLTAIYYAGWYARFFASDRTTVAVVGATGIAVIFSVVAVARGSWSRRPISIADTITAIVAELFGLYYLWDTLQGEHRVVLAFVLIGFALWNIGLLWVLDARRALARVLEEVLLLFAAGSLLLVIPAVLRAEGAVAAWSLAAVLLADAGARSRRVTLQVATCVALGATLWAGVAQEVWHRGVFDFVLNGVFVAWFVVALGWYLAGWRVAVLYPARTLQHVLGRVAQVAGSALLLGLLSYEIATWFRGEMQTYGADRDWLSDLRTAALLALWGLFPAVYLWRARRSGGLWALAAAHYVVLGIGFVALMADLHHSDALVILNLQFPAAVLFPAGVFVVARGIARSVPALKTPLELYGHVLAVILLSSEIYGVLGLREWSESREWIRTALVSVAWTLYAFAVIWLGVWRERAAWRWFALGLLGLTLLKVFFVDTARVEQIWRVLSFAVLGTLLMGCSYVYARHERKKKAELEKDDAKASPNAN